MIEFYTKQELNKFDGRAMKEALTPFQFTRDALLWIPSKNPIRARKLVNLKNFIEYRYCLPMIIKDGGLLLGRYSTYKFLNITKEFIKCSRNKHNYINGTLQAHKKSRIVLYAAGAIEKAPDHGVGYRRELKKCLKMTKAKVVDPCDFKYNKEHVSLTEYGKHHSLAEYYRQCKKTVTGDLDSVLNADAIVLNVDEYLGSGSTSEITVANAINKPVYGIVAKGYDITTMNPWALGNVSRFFKDMNAFREFLIEGE